MTAQVRRQRLWARAATLLCAAVAVAALALPVPFVTTQPGPVFDLYGEQDGEQIITIEDAATYATPGRLDMVLVSAFGSTEGIAIGRAATAWLLPSRTVEPRDVRFPPGTEPEQEQRIEQAVFDASASTALAATANYLGRPVASQALVSQVEPGAPAAGSLESGDIITAIDSTTVTTSAGVRAAVASAEAGSDITVDFLRDGTAETVSIASGSRGATSSAYLGVLVVDNYTSDFGADVALDGIGGPSAGLVFTLAMVDAMTPEPLLDGRHIAGTGTIDAQGRVGPIGGADKKAVSAADAGAELFVVPKDNCADLGGRIPAGLTVVAVDTLAAAIDSIIAWRSGDGELPTCS